MSDHMNMGIMTTRIGRAICQKLEGMVRKTRVDVYVDMDIQYVGICKI